MRCCHRPGLISIGGFYTCPLCFQRVRHPWAPAEAQARTIRESRMVETGIERMARERDDDWLAQVGVQRP